MKTKLILAVVITVMLVGYGCKKSNNAPSSPTPTPVAPAINGSCTATFDGTNWTANSISVTETTDTFSHMPTTALQIQATNASTPYSVDIAWTWMGGKNNGPTSGSYSLTGYTQASIIFYIGQLACNHTMSGTLTILSVDASNKIISGTFNMEAAENNTDHFLTNGVFNNVHY